MRRELSARELVDQVLGERLGRYPALRPVVNRLLADVPLDFPVIIVGKLPFGLHRRRMIGVTIGSRVWILEKYLHLSPVRLLGLIRHEAEHVRQQRSSPLLFYPRYGLGWICNVLRRRPGIRAERRRRRDGRFHAAYREILDERTAYLAGARFEQSLRREMRRLGINPQNF